MQTARDATDHKAPIDSLPSQIAPSSTFALWPIVAGRCGCSAEDCKAAGKHPRHDLPPVQGPAGYGIMCGSVENGGAGIFVVDVDDPSVLPTLDAFPDTLTFRTSRGIHMVFSHPGKRVKNSRSALAAGVDIKGDGGWIVGPGSPHASGATYLVEKDVPIARAPQWLLNWEGLYKVHAEGTGEHSPNALKPGTKGFASAVAFLKNYCETTRETDGSLALLAVGRMAMQASLCPEDSLPIVREYFNPRATNERTGETEWTDQEIMRKLETAWRNEFNLPTGIGWIGGDFDATAARLAKPPILRAEPVKDNDRQVKDPHHVHTFIPGFEQPLGQARKATPFDLVHALTNHPEWIGVLQYDRFADREYAVNPPLALDLETIGRTDADIAALQVYLQCRDLSAGIDAIHNAVTLAARRNAFHPILEYLNSLPAMPVDDARAYLDGLCRQWFDPDANAVECGYLTKFLVGAVRRIQSPGVEMHTMLVLYGAGGVGKSTWVKVLFGEQFTRSQMPTLEGRDASHALQGMWAVEIGELAALLRTETSAAKEFISRSVDQYRQIGTKDAITKPRACVFVGTTNEGEFLRDTTGNRRFWPLKVVQSIPRNIDRDMVWSAAKALASDTTFAHWEEVDQSEANEASKSAYAELDPWHEAIAELCYGEEKIRSKDIYQVLYAGAGLAGYDQKVERRITHTLRRLGCKRVVLKEDKINVRFWSVPGHLSSMPKAKKPKGML